MFGSDFDQAATPHPGQENGDIDLPDEQPVSEIDDRTGVLERRFAEGRHDIGFGSLTCQ